MTGSSQGYEEETNTTDSATSEAMASLETWPWYTDSQLRGYIQVQLTNRGATVRNWGLHSVLLSPVVSVAVLNFPIHCSAEFMGTALAHIMNRLSISVYTVH